MIPLSGYSRVADLYDTVVQFDLDIPFFLKETSKAGGEVLELMSGTGRVSLPLIESGVKLTCVDKSTEMLDVLRRKLAPRGLSAEIVQMDVRDLDLPRRFDLIIIPFHSFAEIVSLADERHALARIREHLAPQGRVICTLRNPAVVPLPDGTVRLFSKHPLPDGQGTLLFWISGGLNPEDRHIVDIVEFFEEYDAAGTLKSKRLLELQARRIAKGEFRELAQAAGFEIVALYGDYAYGNFQEESSPFMIWELSRAD